ncbi:unnamed protein product [Polarella glacialis]|uniref:Uncharacterized protein n=1 Tax=Polarella glacialis TaxID=89957 RepID=A0A813J6Y7_POLGL|nr:unnamed protein product [Polarella glacialis]
MDVQTLGPGDVVCVQGTDRFSAIGAVGGYLGHVLVVLGQPRLVQGGGDEAEELRTVLPTPMPWPLWLLKTFESTSSVTGLHTSNHVIHVEESTGRFRLLGEIQWGEQFIEYEGAVAEFWKAPAPLRSAFRTDLMNEVLEEMKESQDSWSLFTAVRAVLRSAFVEEEADQLATLRELQECWVSKPICTSVIICFWQRYLCKLPAACREDADLHAARMVLQWMPLKADRALPGDLLSTMLKYGWTSLKERSRTLTVRTA